MEKIQNQRTTYTKAELRQLFKEELKEQLKALNKSTFTLEDIEQVFSKTSQNKKSSDLSESKPVKESTEIKDQEPQRISHKNAEKYRILSESRKLKTGVDVYQIEALRDIPYHKIRKGEKGGWLEKDAFGNVGLSQEGNAWVGPRGIVLSGASVAENAYVNGVLKEGAVVFGNAVISKNVIVKDAIIHGEIIAAPEKDEKLYIKEGEFGMDIHPSAVIVNNQSIEQYQSESEVLKTIQIMQEEHKKNTDPAKSHFKYSAAFTDSGYFSLERGIFCQLSYTHRLSILSFFYFLSYLLFFK